MHHRHYRHNTPAHRCAVVKQLLMRVPGSFFDVKVELRGIDDDLAAILIKGPVGACLVIVVAQSGDAAVKVRERS
jgi:hypothetical protein